MDNNFYVYEWIRLDTNEPFYVGKGTGIRAGLLHGRNRYFNNIIKKLGIDNIAVCILHENIDEKTALEYEIYYINLYKYYFGFNLTNLTEGGEGTAGGRWTHSETSRKNISDANWLRGNGHLIKGEKNPFHGRGHTRLGAKNPMYGKRGKDSPHYGKGHLKAGEKSAFYGRTGKDHPASKPIIVYKDGKFYGEYVSCFEFAKTMGSLKSDDPIGKGANKLINGWIPKWGRYEGFTAKLKEG